MHCAQRHSFPLLLMCLAFGASAAPAQPAPHGAERPEQQKKGHVSDVDNPTAAKTSAPVAPATKQCPTVPSRAFLFDKASH